MKKIITTVISVLLIVSLLVGCSNGKVTGVYDENSVINKLGSETVASNERFELSWNGEGKFVSLLDKTAQKTWSTIPLEYYESGGTSDNVNSPLNITVVNAAKAQWDTVSGHAGSVKKDRVSVQKTDKGIKVTYYFDNYLISIPVSYELYEDRVRISVDSSEIVEEGNSALMSFALTPFLCSVQNTSENSYLFIPSGSGGLMYTDERAEGTRKYKAEVYGEDQARLLPEEAVEKTKIYLPVYGVKDDQSALLAVISEGAERAEIYAEAGNRRTGYSTVYPNFYVRGYDVVETTQWLWGYRDLNRISDDKVNTVYSVDFYPLNGSDADYNGMAVKYKECLFGEGKGATGNKAPMYSLNILGGVTYRSAAWGIPHNKLYTLTSFKEAEKIITTLNEKTGHSAAAVLQGFSATGIDIGKIGNFETNGAYGSKKELSSLIAKCKELNALLSVDFDIVRFNRSSSGYSYMLDAAKSATLRTVQKYGVNIPVRSYDDDDYRMLKRSKLDGAVDDLINFAEKNSFSGISLMSLGSIAYSDFDSEQFSVKGGMASQVSQNIEKISKSGIKVSVWDANGYAAKSADILLSVPDDNGNYFVLDEEIPFYQMIFCGTKPMYSKGLNLSENIKKSVMKAVSTGVHFGFTVAENYDIVCASSKNEKLYGTKYSNVEADIIELVKEYSEFYESISQSGIKGYELLENGVSKTVFENGTQVYANHSDKQVNSDVGTIDAYGIKIVK